MPADASPIEYRDPLPDGCPPDTAEVITERRVLYHFTFDPVDLDNDFRSLWQKQPGTRRIAPRDECNARGLTMWDDLDAAKSELARLQRQYRGKRVGDIWAARRICEVELSDGAGAILKTYKDHHWTWWPAAGYIDDSDAIEAHTTVLGEGDV